MLLPITTHTTVFLMSISQIKKPLVIRYYFFLNMTFSTIFHVITQLHSSDEDVIDGAMFLIKAVIFRTNSSPAAICLPDTRHIDAIVPSLLLLLDGRDDAAKAAVTLIAEFCLL